MHSFYLFIYYFFSHQCQYAIMKCSMDVINQLMCAEPLTFLPLAVILLFCFVQYFKTKPYACDPSSLPKYTPCKEIDAKHREEARR